MRIRLYQEGLLTADEFFRFCGGRKLELWDGRVEGLSTIWEYDHACEGRIGAAVTAFVEQNQLGQVYLEDGAGDRDSGEEWFSTLYFIPNSQFANAPIEDGVRTVRYELVCENASRGQLAEWLNNRVQQHLNEGIRVVWVLYPEQRQIHVWEPGPTIRVLSNDGVLDGGSLIPGFRLNLAEIWD